MRDKSNCFLKHNPLPSSFKNDTLKTVRNVSGVQKNFVDLEFNQFISNKSIQTPKLKKSMNNFNKVK